MANVLFWNLARKDLTSLVAAIVKDLDVDLVLLAELGAKAEQVRLALGREMPTVVFERPQFSLCEKITVFIRHSNSFWKPVSEGRRFTISKLDLPARKGILVAAAHLPSRLFSDEQSVNAECARFAERIRAAETTVGTTRTVVVGDLNVNPFDNGAVVATGLHGVMTRAIAAQGSRTVNEEEYPFLYNPMWSLFGDSSKGPPGSYFYRGSGHHSLFWHIFDQVMVRPSLLSEFPEGGVRLLSEIRETKLLRNGTPHKAAYSDHLPLIFKLKLQTSLRKSHEQP